MAVRLRRSLGADSLAVRHVRQDSRSQLNDSTMSTRTILLLAAPLGALVASFSFPRSDDPLPSWRDTPTKASIIDFVERVIDESSVEFVPVSERVAVFDNDGTLICEKPLYSQMAFMVDRARAYIEDEPELAGKEPYKSLVEGTLDPHADMKAFLDLAMDTHTGMLDSEFIAVAESWLTLGRHPRFGRAYDELVYQPMLELMDYLREHDFQVWICTGGGLDFVRCYSREAYGVPPENVIGTSGLKTYVEVDGKGVLMREGKLVEPLNDGPGKPVNINRHIGRVPILAVGNSDGDLEMMGMTADHVGPSLLLLVHHDDAEREYDYDEGTNRALGVADSRGWRVVSIAEDFADVFPSKD